MHLTPNHILTETCVFIYELDLGLKITVPHLLFICANTSPFKKQKNVATHNPWNDAVNAEIISYVCSYACPCGGLNGVNIYCNPSRGTSNKVALWWWW